MLGSGAPALCRCGHAPFGRKVVTVKRRCETAARTASGCGARDAGWRCDDQAEACHVNILTPAACLCVPSFCPGRGSAWSRRACMDKHQIPSLTLSPQAVKQASQDAAEALQRALHSVRTYPASDAASPRSCQPWPRRQGRQAPASRPASGPAQTTGTWTASQTCARSWTEIPPLRTRRGRCPWESSSRGPRYVSGQSWRGGLRRLHTAPRRSPPSGSREAGTCPHLRCGCWRTGV